MSANDAELFFCRAGKIELFWLTRIAIQKTMQAFVFAHV